MAALTILKGYLDDGGSESLPAISVAGFVGGDRCWEVFEPVWEAALDKHEIPYFHFNEICDPKSPLHKFYGREGADLQRALLIDLAEVLTKCSFHGIHMFSSVVPTEAMARFNVARGRKVDPISFALFNCIHMMQF